MKKYTLANNQKLSNILILCLLIISLYFGRDTLVSTVWLDFSITQIFICVLLMLYTILFLVNNRKYIIDILKDKRFIFFIAISAVFLLLMVIKKDFTLMYMSCILAIYFSVFLSYTIKFKDLMKYYVNIIFVLTFASLIINYVLKGLIFENYTNSMLIYNSQGLSFINCIFTFLVNDPAYIRNFSIFREPGVFQFFLIIAIILESTYIKRKNIIHKGIINLILIFGSISTFSTSAFIQLVLVLLALLIKNFKAILRSKYIYFFIAALVGLFALAIYFIFTNETIYWTVWSMFTKLTRINESLLSRMESVTVNLDLFFKSPLLGQKISTVLYALDNTTSSLILFSCYGIIIGVIINAMWLTMFTFKKGEIVQNICFVLFLLALFFSFNSQNLTTNFYFYLFPIFSFFKSGILKRTIKRGEKNENIMDL